MPPLAVLLDPDDPVVDAASADDPRSRAMLLRELGWAAGRPDRGAADPLADLLLDRVLAHEGPFAVLAQRRGAQGITPLLRSTAADELRSLQVLAGATRMPADSTPAGRGPRAIVKRSISSLDDWGDGVDELAAHFRRFGAGILYGQRVLRWDGGLQPARHPDSVSLDDLVGYERERELLIENVRGFVAGLPANNALLYGDRGSGKSSTVKAIANSYAMEELRLVEVPRHQLGSFAVIVDELASRAARFLVLIDDMSFDDTDEAAFAALKSLLEGGVEAQPANVLLYATSNRRHLVRETQDDRRGGGEVHVSDSFQEKVSLSDRFGLRVLFLAPDQSTYLRICRDLAIRRGIDPVPPNLDALALQWCQRHNARSCRTARQFVDHLTARYRLATAPGPLA